MRIDTSILTYASILLLLADPAFSFSTFSRGTATTRKILRNGSRPSTPLTSPTGRLLPTFSPLKIPSITFKKNPSSSSTALSSTLATLGASIGLDAAVAGASLAATAKLLSSIGLGGLAAKKDNLLDAAAISALSRLAYGIFQPAFLIVSISSTLCNTAMSTGGLSGGMPRQLLGLSCLASAIQLLITFLVGKVITRVASFKGDEARDVQLCVTFQNCGPLPLVFADALFSGSLLSDVTACISFYLLAWSPIFWSVGRMILGTYGESDASVSLPKRMVKEIQKFLSPPVVGALLGLVIGSVPFLRQAFFGGWASPLFGALKTLGMAYLPSALLVLAGSLFVKKPPALTNGVEEMTTSPLNGDPARTSSTGPSLKAIVAIMLTRFGIVPLVALTSVRVYDYFGLLGVGRTKAVVSFCLLMQGCMPPAQNSVLLYSLAGLKERASAMAKILALMYSLSVIPVTILLTYCLSVSGIAAFR